MIKDYQKTKDFFSFFKVSLIILSLILFACYKEPEKIERKPSTLKVYTSLFAFEHFVKNILPDAEIESLIPKGVDPHQFEPSLKDIQNLYSANMIIYIGDTDLDRWIDKIKDELIQRGIRIIRLQDSLTLKKYHSSKELDPHIWLDPVISLEILKLIKNIIVELSPKGKDIINRNFANYEQKLKELDNAYRETLSKCILKDVISTHEFLNYLGARYGFTSHFIVQKPENEPSPKKIKMLKELIKKKGIVYVISEPEGEKIAKIFSQETGTKILNFNTYHTVTEKDYINAMKDNLKVLATVLKCEIKNGR
ncbi:MAG: zinc ABC transporter substrate-binding protein [Thermodesulfovibrio sp.]|nr:zinc ABC transporter substrate-binding protein [Thermodesulfovibrio sp.]